MDLPKFAPLIEQFKQATNLGLKIFLLTGNRDFLLGDKFFQLSGIKKIKEPFILDIAGDKAVLLHGDKLCTDDLPYQRMRIFLQNPISKIIFQLLPKSWLLKISSQLKNKTNKSKQKKTAMIMDVNQTAVEKFMRRHQCQILIHGHTHRAKIHQEPAGKRYVLGDWQKQGEILVYDGEFRMVANSFKNL